jgi:hypothetical protein
MNPDEFWSRCRGKVLGPQSEDSMGSHREQVGFARVGCLHEACILRGILADSWWDFEGL